MFWRILALTSVLAAPAGVAVAQEGDAEDGKSVFRRCVTCHKVGEGARNAVGPILNDVFGRQAGTVDGYRYSALNSAAGENGLVWTTESMFEYLANPQEYLVAFLEEQGKGDLVKGRTKMPFKLADEQQRRDVIAYLLQFSDAPDEEAEPAGD